MSRCSTVRGPSWRSLFMATGFGLVALALAPDAAAHIRLLDPQPRYDITGFDTGIKSCPCGLGSSNRTCNVAADSSDPDRGMRVTRAEAGSTITLRFEEYVDHTGTYRVAFDDDGADIADFNANILVPMVPDPSGGLGNIGEGAMWEIDVTLPNMTCTNCTLQLVQAMNNNTTTPVADPSAVSSYYTCVDLELVAPGTLGEGDPMDDPGDMEPGDGMDDPTMTGSGTMGQGTMGQGTMGQGTMGSGTMGVQPTGSTGMVGGTMGAAQGNTGTANMGDDDPIGSGVMNPATGMGSSSGGGCRLGSPRTSAASGAAALVLAGLASMLCIRRRSARAA